MEKFTDDGIVMRTSVTGESDIIVWVLTRSRGVIRAFAKGARGIKNRLHGAVSLFSYCDFTFYENNNVYSINEARIKEMFFSLRLSLKKLTLAQYFCEIMLKILPDGVHEDVYLRLLLNALHFLCTGEKKDGLVKAVFELRTAVESGYMPSVEACSICGEYRTDTMYFNCDTGKLFCSECGKKLYLPPLPFAAVAAIRHICLSDFDRIFSFELSDAVLGIINGVSEVYLSNCFQLDFKLLKYYKIAENE